MDLIQELLLGMSAVAPRSDLKDGSRTMLIKRFKELVEIPILADDDKILGVVYYPTGIIDHAYLVYERESVMLKAPLKQRPIRHAYEDKAYWSKNQTWFKNSNQHQHQHGLWINIFKRRGLPILSVGK